MGWPGIQKMHIQTARMVVILGLLFSCAPVLAQDQISYRITTEQLANHQLQVEAEFPASTFPSRERVLALPVWTPGSYKVRDYSRFLRPVALLNEGGRIEKISKNRWRISGLSESEAVRVRYSLYGHELTVRTNYFSPDLSLVTGAGTFLAPAPLTSDRMRAESYRVSFPDLKDPIYTALPSLGETSFGASSYDELLDSPILFGKLQKHDFQTGGATHSLIQAGDTRYWELEKSLKDLSAVVQAHQAFWGQTPYKNYQFMNLVTDTRGGLEHRNSTVMMTSRFATQDRDTYIGWLSLVSHEFFHTWNVKRLRPTALGPFDYEKEIYTPSLWVAEGITSYYDDLLVRRAGLSTDKEYLKALSGQLNKLLTTPGRKSLPLTQASLDAWIRLYQPTEDSINSSISYYNKGAVVAWLLDTEIRRRTEGKKSLDDVMRAAYTRFEKSGFEEREFRELCESVSGLDLKEFFALTLDSTEELPLQPTLDYWGLSWKPKSTKTAKKPYFGVTKADSKGRLLVKSVHSDSPAARAGVSPGDELIALDGVRFPTSVDPLLKGLKLEQPYELLVSRLGRLRTLEVTLTTPPHAKSALKVDRKEAKYEERRGRWLSSAVKP